ncbi:MAG: hypothetical protein ABII06_07545 [Pseudomonadota bacterium]
MMAAEIARGKPLEEINDHSPTSKPCGLNVSGILQPSENRGYFIRLAYVSGDWKNGMMEEWFFVPPFLYSNIPLGAKTRFQIKRLS